MTTGRRRLWILSIIAVILVIGGFVFHHLRNRPFAIMGYWDQWSGVLQDTGDHFNHVGVLEVDFHYKEPFVNGMKHNTYSLVQVGKSKPILDSINLGSSSPLPQGSWDELRFPIGLYLPPNKLKLNTGKYILELYIDGKMVASKSFYVDKPIAIQGR